jgi:hypothetical protein
LMHATIFREADLPARIEQGSGSGQKRRLKERQRGQATLFL